jgi:opacity protein-like surface antigen
MRTLRTTGVFVLLSIILAAAGPLGADVKAELGFGWSLHAPALSTSYLNQFVPPMTPTANYIGSSASQTVRLNGKVGTGMSGFLNILINDRFGVQVLVDYFRPNVGGSNSAFDIALDYTTTGAREYTRSDAWPDSKGNFTETTYSLNGLVRFPIAPDLTFSLSGGPTAFYLKGEAMGMGYCSFRLEQDVDVYTLFIKTFQLVYDFGPKTTYGFNLGGEVAYTVVPSVILALDVRYFLSTKEDFQMHITPNDGLTEDAEAIEEALNLGSIRIDPSYFRVSLTLRFKF